MGLIDLMIGLSACEWAPERPAQEVWLRLLSKRLRAT
jgi:hypothetical protein